MKDWMVQHLEAMCAVFIAFMDYKSIPESDKQFLVFCLSFHRFIVRVFNTWNRRITSTIKNSKQLPFKPFNLQNG